MPATTRGRPAPSGGKPIFLRSGSFCLENSCDRMNQRAVGVQDKSRARAQGTGTMMPGAAGVGKPRDSVGRSRPLDATAQPDTCEPESRDGSQVAPGLFSAGGSEVWSRRRRAAIACDNGEGDRVDGVPREFIFSAKSKIPTGIGALHTDRAAASRTAKQSLRLASGHERSGRPHDRARRSQRSRSSPRARRRQRACRGRRRSRRPSRGRPRPRRRKARRRACLR